MRFTFEFEGKVQFDRSFNRVGEHISDLRPVWDRVERKLFEIEETQFKSEGARGRSGKWKPLSRAYAARKAKTHPGKPILQRSGALYKAMTSNTGDTILVKDKQEFGLGTSLFYMPYVNAVRPVVSLSDGQQTDLMKEIQMGLLEIIKRDPQINLEVVG